MAFINLLDKHTAELIAAGEVVERPASVVKELIENAIDAGSSAIKISILRGGVGLIEVEDNGSGIETDQVQKAFVRHATSKIFSGDDLNHIGTLGFRGEALASIAAVARVKLITCTSLEEEAVCYSIAGGEEGGLAPAARPTGSTIQIADLFYNTPARMKFLKKDQSEANLVQDVASNLALSHPEISFRFLREEKEIFHTPGDGKLLSAIYALYGREFAKGLMPIAADDGAFAVGGYVSMPAHARASRAMQFFYINGRYVKNRTMMAALEAACRGYVMAGKFPACVMELQMPPEEVDVNVHPAKTEVRFSNEKTVFNLVYQAVRSAVTSPAAGEKQIHLPPQPAASQPSGAAAQQAFLEEPPVQHPAVPDSAAPESLLKKVQGSYEGALRSQPAQPYRVNRHALDIQVTAEEAPPLQKGGEEMPAAAWPETAPEAGFSGAPAFQQEKAEAPSLVLLGEAFQTYILAECGEYLVFIDKHAAHERLLYEKLMAGVGAACAQLLLVPVNVALSGAEKNALLQERELVEAAGVDFDDFGGGTVLVRAVPSNVSEGEIPLLLQEIAQKLAQGAKDARSEKQEWIYASIACRGAIKAGDRSTQRELLALAQEVLDGKVPLFCPHGRPILLKLTQKEIEKYFGRLG